MTNVFFIGPAGSGKTTLAYSMGKWMKKEGISFSHVNLDPGADFIPYKADFDIRHLVTVTDLMRNEKLSSNGALVRASEIIEDSIGIILTSIQHETADFILIDTPGQMELFLFRNLGQLMSSGLKGRSACVFVTEPSFLLKVDDLAVLKIMNIAIELRLGLPSIQVINKSDLMSLNNIDTHVKFPTEEGFHYNGISDEITTQLLNVIEAFEKRKRTLKVSAKNGMGMDDLYKSIGELSCACGDLS